MRSGRPEIEVEREENLGREIRERQQWDTFREVHRSHEHEMMTGQLISGGSLATTLPSGAPIERLGSPDELPHEYNLSFQNLGSPATKTKLVWQRQNVCPANRLRSR
jgi:hypothetical protein